MFCFVVPERSVFKDNVVLCQSLVFPIDCGASVLSRSLSEILILLTEDCSDT